MWQMVQRVLRKHHSFHVHVDLASPSLPTLLSVMGQASPASDATSVIFLSPDIFICVF